MKDAVVLFAHGTVESLDDLPAFLRNIRRGHAAPPELVAEVRRRYEAIGGRSPLLDISRDLATKVEAKLSLPTRLATRLFHPYPDDVLRELGAERVIMVPLAQHSAAVYAAAMTAAARKVEPAPSVLCADNWGRTTELIRGYADAVAEALPGEDAAVVFTAHSLPLSIIEGGDPYEREFRASVDDVVAELRARGVRFAEHVIAFQSQGIGTGMKWLGPELLPTLEALAARGRKRVVLAPIGFLADHVEILYDLDVEAKVWAGELGMVLYRSRSLNASEAIVDAIVSVVRGVLARDGTR